MLELYHRLSQKIIWLEIMENLINRYLNEDLMKHWVIDWGPYYEDPVGYIFFGVIIYQGIHVSAVVPGSWEEDIITWGLAEAQLYCRAGLWQDSTQRDQASICAFCTLHPKQVSPPCACQGETIHLINIISKFFLNKKK